MWISAFYRSNLFELLFFYFKFWVGHSLFYHMAKIWRSNVITKAKTTNLCQIFPSQRKRKRESCRVLNNIKIIEAFHENYDVYIQNGYCTIYCLHVTFFPHRNHTKQYTTHRLIMKNAIPIFYTCIYVIRIDCYLLNFSSLMTHILLVFIWTMFISLKFVIIFFFLLLLVLNMKYFN